jgi:hypothetical protein
MPKEQLLSYCPSRSTTPCALASLDTTGHGAIDDGAVGPEDPAESKKTEITQAVRHVAARGPAQSTLGGVSYRRRPLQRRKGRSSWRPCSAASGGLDQTTSGRHNIGGGGRVAPSAETEGTEQLEALLSSFWSV